MCDDSKATVNSMRSLLVVCVLIGATHRLSAADKSRAISRMALPSSDKLHMPPALFRTLPDAALKLAIDALK